MFHSLRFGFHGLGRDLSTRWADIQTVGGLNRLQWTGGDDDTVLVEGVIFPEEFGGLVTLEALRAAAEEGAVLPLISLGGLVYGMFVIELVKEDRAFIDRLGRPRKNVYRIGLKRFVGNAFSPVSVVQTLFG